MHGYVSHLLMHNNIKMVLETTINHLKSQPSWLLIPVFFGMLSLFKNSILLLKWIFIIFFRPTKNLKKYGSWAVITGSTDGIGKAFAFQLAKKGLNLVLVSRNHQKLQQVCQEIKQEFPYTNIKTITLDFSDIDMDSGSFLDEFEEGIKGLDVGVLINNVGVTYPTARYFHEVEEEVWRNVVSVNVKGTTLITKAVISGMVKKKKKKRGAIVNIGSGASVVLPSHPLFAVYAATKAYIDQLSRSLHVEYRYMPIDIQCQIPLYVSTKMSSRVAQFDEKKSSSIFIPSAQDYAEAGVRRIGYEAQCTPFWSHSIQWTFASMLPHIILHKWRLSIGIHRRTTTRSDIHF